jgi:acetylornithine deacetylase
MKGFIAAVLAASLKARLTALKAPLHVAISHDEELGCAGIPLLLDALQQGDAIPAPLAGVVVGEPTGMEVVDRHKGKVAFDIAVRGRPAHSATPSLGVNAVRGAAHLILELEQLELDLARETRDEAFVVPHAAVGIGPIAGGVALNIVPDRCSLKVEVRLLPGQTAELIEDRVRAVADRVAASWAGNAQDAGIDVKRIAGYPPLRPETSQAAFGDWVAHLTGRQAGGAVDFGTEAGIYQQRLKVPVVVCGPGSMAQGHVADEFLTADQLGSAEAFVARLVQRLKA